MASTVKLNIKGGPERSFMACCRIVLVVAVVTLTACAETRPKHDATVATEQATPAVATPKPCEPPRFTPLGTPLARAALDTKMGQQCRTAENAPPFARSLPMCRDLLVQFPD